MTLSLTHFCNFTPHNKKNRETSGESGDQTSHPGSAFSPQSADTQLACSDSHGTGIRPASIGFQYLAIRNSSISNPCQSPNEEN